MKDKKILSASGVKKILNRCPKRTIVFTNGCFDILHTGHIRYLKKAKLSGDILVVGLNSDKSVKQIKGNNRPINPEKDRAELLAALECVDFVVLFSENTPENLIKKIRPHILVKGGDWKKSDIVGADFVTSYGGKVKVIPYVKNRSTTNIIEKIASSQ